MSRTGIALVTGATSGIGQAAALGLAPGDVVLRIGGARLAEAGDFASAFVRYRMQNSLILVVGRAGRAYYTRLNV